MIPDPIYKEIGAIIRKRRKVLEMTQVDLSAKLGISRGALANIETGRQNILAHQLYKYASVLKLAPADLLPPYPTNVVAANLNAVPIPGNLSRSQAEQIARLFQDAPADIKTGR